MTRTDLCVNKPQSDPVIFEPPCKSISLDINLNHFSKIKYFNIISTIKTLYIMNTGMPYHATLQCHIQTHRLQKKQQLYHNNCF